MQRGRASRSVSFDLPRADRVALGALSWEAPLDDWPSLGVQAIYARRGESRHTVLFVEADGGRYAIKETPLVRHQRLMGERANHEISLEEAALDYALRQQRSELLQLVRPEDQHLEPLAPAE